MAVQIMHTPLSSSWRLILNGFIIPCIVDLTIQSLIQCGKLMSLQEVGLLVGQESLVLVMYLGPRMV